MLHAILHRALETMAQILRLSARVINRRHYKRILVAALILQVLVCTIIWSDGDDSSESTWLSPLKSSFYTKDSYFSSGKKKSDPNTGVQIEDLWDQIRDASKSTTTSLKQLYEKLRYDTNFNWVDKYTLQKNLLVPQTGHRKNEKWNHIEDIYHYDFDPRLSWTVYLDHILTYGNTTEDLVLPFSWYDWADFKDINKLISLRETRLTCMFLYEGVFNRDELVAIEEEIGENLFDRLREFYNLEGWYNYALQFGSQDILHSINKYCQALKQKPKFSTGLVPLKTTTSVRPEVYRLQLRNYLLERVRLPISFTFTNSNDNTYQIYLNPNRTNMIQSGMLQNFVYKQIPIPPANGTLFDSPDIHFDHLSKYEEFLNTPEISDKFLLKVPDSDINFMEMDEIDLSAEDFEFDIEEKIKELESLPKEKMNPHFKHYLESLKATRFYNEANCERYFQLSLGIQGRKDWGWHVDGTFYNGDLMEEDPQEYAARLNSMIKTFQKFSLNNGIVSWLTHGTLLSYMYNGKAFPNDEDFDLKMPLKHLHILAQYFNQTLLLQDPAEGNGRYLIDVNAYIGFRARGNTLNNIDARLIDIDTGLYIDLTAVAASPGVPRHSMNEYIEQRAKEMNIDLENYTVLSTIPASNLTNLTRKDVGKMDILQLKTYSDQHPGEFTKKDKEEIKKQIEGETQFRNSDSPEHKLGPAERYDFHRKIEMFGCKDYHFLPLSELSPLVNTRFHGNIVFVPKKSIKILKREYNFIEKWGVSQFDDWTFIPYLMEWVNVKFLEKTANLHGWFRNFAKLNHTQEITELEFSDMGILLNNTARYRDDNKSTFANLFTSFHQFVYRLKEISIQYDKSLDLANKENLLKGLRQYIAPKISSPSKDATLFLQEKRAYQEFVKKFDSEVVTQIENEIDKRYIDKYWNLLQDLKSKNLEFLQVGNEYDHQIASGEDTEALNNNQNLNFNFEGIDTIYPNNTRDCLEIFIEDYR